MLAFCALASDFLRRAMRSPSYRERKAQPGVQAATTFVRHDLGFVWIIVRCLYRMVELAEGWRGYLITHQPFFICLDAVPMVLCPVVFIIAFPPPFYIPSHGRNAKEEV